MITKLRSWLWPSKVTVAPISRYVFGGYSTDAAIDVTPESAEQLATVHACVQTISDDFAGLPARVCQRLPNGTRRRVREHYLTPKLNDSPNPLMTSATYRSVQMRSKLLRGTAYSYIEKRGTKVANLWPLRPWQIRPTFETGDLAYWVKPTATAEPELVSPEYVLAVPYVSDDGICGKSPIEVAANVVGVSLGLDKFAARYFANGIALSGYIKHPGDLSPEGEAELKLSWAGAYGGADNAHQVPVLGEGSEFVAISATPEQAQFLASRAYSVTELCRLYRVNPVVVGDLSKSSYATYAAVRADYVRSTIRPHLDRWEQELSRKLLTEGEKAQGYYVEFDPDGLMRGDRESQDKSFATGIQFGWYSKNDVRDLLNLPPIPGGDEYLSPLNMAPTGAQESEPEPPQEQPAADDSQDTETNDADPVEQQRAQRRADADRLNPLLQDAVRRMLVKETNAIKRASSRHADLLSWADEWYEGHEELVRSAVLPAFTTYDAVTAHGRSADYATKHVQDSLQDLRDALSFDALSDLYTRWTERRPFAADLWEDHD